MSDWTQTIAKFGQLISINLHEIKSIESKKIQILNRNTRIFLSIQTEFKTIYQVFKLKSTALHDSLVAVVVVFLVVVAAAWSDDRLELT